MKRWWLAYIGWLKFETLSYRQAYFAAIYLPWRSLRFHLLQVMGLGG